MVSWLTLTSVQSAERSRYAAIKPRPEELSQLIFEPYLWNEMTCPASSVRPKWLTWWEFFPTRVPHMAQSLFPAVVTWNFFYNSFQGVQQVVLVQEKGVHKPPKTWLFFMGKRSQPDARKSNNKCKLHKSWGSLTCTDINTHPSSAYTLNKQDIHILARSRQTWTSCLQSSHSAQLSYLAPSWSYWSCHQTERKESCGKWICQVSNSSFKGAVW